MPQRSPQRILAINVRPRRFGFVVFEEGPARALDWGARSTRGKDCATRVPLGPKLAKLIMEYAPEAIVVTEPNTDTSRRSVDKVMKYVQLHHIRSRMLSAEAVSRVLTGHNDNKDQIAAAVAERCPELLSTLPPRRRPWQNEDSGNRRKRQYEVWRIPESELLRFMKRNAA
jgi:hypothetical protein